MKRILFAIMLSLGASIGVMSGALAAVPVAATSISTVVADVDDFSFASYDADYWLSRADDGAAVLRTVETLVAEFPNFDQNRGIVRAIPNDYDGVPLNPEVMSVVDEDGDAVAYETSTEDGFLVVAVGTDDYVQGQQTYTIEYTQHNVVRSFADTGSDELYWDTTGTGFAQSFGRVSARFHVANDLATALNGNSACYAGVEGSTAQCSITESVDDAGPVFSAETTDLAPGGNVTVAIGFEPGTFVVPDPPTPAAWAYIVPVILMILVGLGSVVAVVVQLRAPRDATSRGIIIPQYGVPEATNLFIAGDIVRRRSTSVPAEIISLAVRGNLQILDEGDDDYSLRFLSDDKTDTQEQELLAALFGSKRARGKLRALKTPDSKMATRLTAITKATKAEVVAAGLRTRSRWVPGRVMLGVLIILFVIAVIVFILNFVLSPVPSVVGILVFPVAALGVVVGGLCAYRPAILTADGAKLRDYITGLKMYLSLAEADRFRLLQSPEGALRVDADDQQQVVKLYEKLLPYAVLWGVERQWSEQLAVRYEQAPPDWYVGSAGFNPVLFGTAMHSFTRSAVTAASPVYSGSGGGSFSGGSMGGGFSGGGGGGGGGGGR